MHKPSTMKGFLISGILVFVYTIIEIFSLLALLCCCFVCNSVFEFP